MILRHIATSLWLVFIGTLSVALGTYLAWWTERWVAADVVYSSDLIPPLVIEQ